MSVDSRLREALGTEDATWQTRTDPSYDAVVAGARRRRTTRNVAVAGGIAAAALAATLVLVPGDASSRLEPAPSGPTPSTFHHPEAPYETGPLDGTWRTDPITRTDIEANLRAAGLDEYAAAHAATYPRGEFRLTLRVSAGHITVDVGAQRARQREFLIEADSRVRFRPGSAGFGSTIYDWQVEDGNLTLSLVRSTLSEYDGFPGEVHERALYTTAPFHAS